MPAVLLELWGAKSQPGSAWSLGSVGIARAGFIYAAIEVLSGLTVLPGAVRAYEPMRTALLVQGGASVLVAPWAAGTAVGQSTTNDC